MSQTSLSAPELIEDLFSSFTANSPNICLPSRKLSLENVIDGPRGHLDRIGGVPVGKEEMLSQSTKDCINFNPDVHYICNDQDALNHVLIEYFDLAWKLRHSWEERSGPEWQDSILPPVALDIETYPDSLQGLLPGGSRDLPPPDPKNDHIRLVSFRIGFFGLGTVVLDLKYLNVHLVEGILEQILRWGYLAGHNIMFDLGFLLEKFPVIPPKNYLFTTIWDTMVADQVLSFAYYGKFKDTLPKLPQRKSLDTVQSLWMKVDAPPEGSLLAKKKQLQTSAWEEPALTQEQLLYSASDVAFLPEIIEAQQNYAVHLPGLVPIFPLARRELDPGGALPGKIPAFVALENAVLVPTLLATRRGVPVSRPKVEEILRTNSERRESARDAIREFSRQHPVFAEATSQTLVPTQVIIQNPASSTQIAKYLQGAGYRLAETQKGNPKTDLDSLQKALGPENELYKLFLGLKEADVLATKATELLEYLDNSGFTHPEINTFAAPTGRMSAKKPALMSMPHTGEGVLRSAVQAPEGYTFVDYDYSQVELRIEAVLSQDNFMIQAYKNGSDLHTLTASTVSGKKVQEILPEDRKKAKACNFGLIYGMGLEGFREYTHTSYGISLSEREGRRMIDAFFRKYVGVNDLVQSVFKGDASIAQRFSHIRMVSGGIFAVKTRSGRLIVAGRAREALNYPVQGTGADVLKLATVLFTHRLAREDPILFEKAGIALTIHDEILVLSPTDYQQKVGQLLKLAMEDAFSTLLPEVPAVVSGSSGKCWNEIH